MVMLHLDKIKDFLAKYFLINKDKSLIVTLSSFKDKEDKVRVI